MKLETLAQAVARLSDEMLVRQGDNHAWLFVAYIKDLNNYDLISDAVDDLANSYGIYIGEKHYIHNTNYAEIRVSIAKSGEVYRKQFEVK